MTITMEVGDIQRCKTDGDFASYCRMVDARRLSNGKCKGENNQSAATNMPVTLPVRTNPAG